MAEETPGRAPDNLRRGTCGRRLRGGLQRALPVLAAILCAVSSAASAQNPALQPPPSATEGAIERGLLWSVTGPDIPPSFVFGTIHLEDPRVTELPSLVREKLALCALFVPEAIPDPGAFLEVGGEMFLKGERTLESLVGPSLFEQVAGMLEQQGLPAQMTQLLQPWAATMLLSTPRPQTGMFLDRLLYLEARRQGKTVHPLETLGEQVSLFADLPQSDQIRLLRLAVKQFDRLSGHVEELTQAYLQGDLGTLELLARRHMGDDAELAARIDRRIVSERNERMVSRLLPLLERGSAFIAVGALHLPGRKGMLNLLRNAGFAVHPAR